MQNCIGQDQPALNPSPEVTGKVRRKPVKKKKETEQERLLKKMQKLLGDMFSTLEDLGGKQFILDSVKGDKANEKAFLKEFFALARKYFDLLSAEKAAQTLPGQNGPVTYFMIKNLNVGQVPGLRQDGDAIDVTPIDDAQFKPVGLT